MAPRDWADFDHIPVIATSGTPGLALISPYAAEGDGPLFMHLYEVDSDPTETFADLSRRTSDHWTENEIAAFTFHPQRNLGFARMFTLAAPTSLEVD